MGKGGGVKAITRALKVHYSHLILQMASGTYNCLFHFTITSPRILDLLGSKPVTVWNVNYTSLCEVFGAFTNSSTRTLVGFPEI